jgi:hypothetical protein
MINAKAQEDFRTQLAVGVKRPQLARDAFTPSPPGAFDALPEELSSSVTRGLDALAPGTQRMVMDYLRKRLSRDRDVDDEEETDVRGDANVGNPGIGSEVLDFLRDAGVDPAICQRVEQMLAAGNGDGTLTHGSDVARRS